ncbi:methylmalonyl-CoA epimerase, mitochondrial [Gastrophryne carolinensis]
MEMKLVELGNSEVSSPTPTTTTSPPLSADHPEAYQQLGSSRQGTPALKMTRLMQSFQLHVATSDNTKGCSYRPIMLRSLQQLGKRRRNKEIILAGVFCRAHGLLQAKRSISLSPTLAQKVPEHLWKLGRLNHVAIAVPDLEKAKSLYQNVLGAKVSETVPLPEHGVYTIFIELGNTKLELLHPLGEKSPISAFLQKNKAGGMHHICIEVDDIKVAMSDLKKKNIRLLSEEAKIGAHGKPVVFLHPKDCDGVLVELEEA